MSDARAERRFAITEGIADLATLTKMAGRWAKEREYRLVRYPGVSYSEAGLHFEGQSGYFPPQSIIGITVGTDMPAEHAQMVVEYANQHKPRLPVVGASVLNPDDNVPDVAELGCEESACRHSRSDVTRTDYLRSGGCHGHLGSPDWTDVRFGISDLPVAERAAKYTDRAFD